MRRDQPLAIPPKPVDDGEPPEDPLLHGATNVGFAPRVASDILSAWNAGVSEAYQSSGPYGRANGGMLRRSKDMPQIPLPKGQGLPVKSFSFACNASVVTTFLPAFYFHAPPDMADCVVTIDKLGVTLVSEDQVWTYGAGSISICQQKVPLPFVGFPIASKEHVLALRVQEPSSDVFTSTGALTTQFIWVIVAFQSDSDAQAAHQAVTALVSTQESLWAASGRQTNGRFNAVAPHLALQLGVEVLSVPKLLTNDLGEIFWDFSEYDFVQRRSPNIMIPEGSFDALTRVLGRPFRVLKEGFKI